MGFDLAKAGEAFRKSMGMTGLRIKARSPELLLAIGFVSIGAGIVCAVKAGKKQDAIWEDHLKRVEEAKKEDKITVTEDGTEIIEKKTEKEIKTAVRKEYEKTAANEAHNFASTAFFTVLGIGCVMGSNNIQATRVARFCTAYTGVTEAFRSYENNNIALNGEENHLMCKNGFKEVPEVDENGKTVGTKKVMKSVEEAKKDLPLPCGHEYIFDHSSSQYYGDIKKRGIGGSSMCNLNTLEAVKKQVQNEVNTVGYVSADRAARLLDLNNRSKMQIAIDIEDGWMRGGPPVSFGYEDDPRNAGTMAGHGNQPIYLKFNCHGNLTWLLIHQHKAEQELFQALEEDRFEDERDA